MDDLKAQLRDKSIAVGTLQARLAAEVAAGKCLVQDVAAMAAEKARLAQVAQQDHGKKVGLHSEISRLEAAASRQQASAAAAAAEAAVRHAEVDADMQEAVRRALVAERQLQVGPE